MSDAIKAKIRALLSKTVENGCTEAEALAAVNKAQQMMDQYQLENIDEALGETQIVRMVYSNGKKKIETVVENIAKAVSVFCGVKVWKVKADVIFYGFESDCNFAIYLMGMLRDVCNKGYEYHKNYEMVGTRIHGKTLRSNFELGFAVRIGDRLREMKSQPVMSNGTSLVVMKDQEVTKAFNELDIKIRNAPNRNYNIRSGESFMAGKKQADKVTINRPIE